MAHEDIGSEILDILLVFTHSAHPEVAKLSIQVIKQFALIKSAYFIRNENI